MKTERSNASPRWGVMRRHWVRVGGKLFLTRLQVIQVPWFSVLFTDIHHPDDDRDPHDHSRAFISLIRSGGYAENVYLDPGDLSRYEVRCHGRWSVHLMRSSRAHLITEISSPLRTVVLAGRHRGTWSFWTPQGKVDWKDHE